jgi:hypothetical protein
VKTEFVRFSTNFGEKKGSEFFNLLRRGSPYPSSAPYLPFLPLCPLTSPDRVRVACRLDGELLGGTKKLAPAWTRRFRLSLRRPLRFAVRNPKPWSALFSCVRSLLFSFLLWILSETSSSRVSRIQDPIRPMRVLAFSRSFVQLLFRISTGFRCWIFVGARGLVRSRLVLKRYRTYTSWLVL